jgi:ATP-binding cassette subfamily F protein 3
MIVGELEPTAGSVKLGSRVKVGYFSQQHEGLHKERTVLEEILYEFGTDEETARGYLGAFLFRGDEVERVIGELSGGEQSRLAFLKLMLTGANFLVLDEPTNHLDIPAKEAVEEALMAFPGTFLVVSHDRYFLDKVANVTMELEHGKLTRYDGNYLYYKEKKSAEEAVKAAETPVQAAKEPKREQPNPKKEPTAEREKRIAPPAGVSEEKRQELLQRAEAELAMAEAELKMLEREMNDPELQQDPEKSRRIAEEYAAKEKEIEQRYEKWGALAEG